MVPIMMPPRMLQRLAWGDQDPRAALGSLETSPLHQPEANDSDDVVDARTQNISMLLAMSFELAPTGRVCTRMDRTPAAWP
jgi:hypothetical protein